MKKYSVKLTQAQRHFLGELLSAAQAATRMQVRARILLKADQGEHGLGWTDQRIIEALEVGHATVERTRKQFVEGGLQAALFARPASRNRRRKLDGKQEAHLIAVCCSAAPAGRKRWSLRLLVNRLVELEIVEQISHETVRAVLKKTGSNRGRRSSGVFLPSRMRSLSPAWRTFWKSTRDPMTPHDLRSVWMRSIRNCSKTCGSLLPPSRGTCDDKIMNINAKGSVMCFWLSSH